MRPHAPASSGGRSSLASTRRQSSSRTGWSTLSALSAVYLEYLEYPECRTLSHVSHALTAATRCLMHSGAFGTQHGIPHGSVVQMHHSLRRGVGLALVFCARPAQLSHRRRHGVRTRLARSCACGQCRRQSPTACADSARCIGVRTAEDDVAGPAAVPHGSAGRCGRAAAHRGGALWRRMRRCALTADQTVRGTPHRWLAAPDLNRSQSRLSATHGPVRGTGAQRAAASRTTRTWMRLCNRGSTCKLRGISPHLLHCAA